MTPEFVFMLTRNDATVADSSALLEQIQNIGLKHIGFKDVGLPFEALNDLSAQIHDMGARVYLEVVSETAQDELRSIEAALQLDVDCLLGGTHVIEALGLLKGSGTEYYPFPGEVVGHPSILKGPADRIVKSAVDLANTDGVDGLDLLGYRFDGDVEQLMKDVTAAVDVPVLMAGSIDRASRIDAVLAANAWGFTIGSAIIDGSLQLETTDRTVAGLSRAVLSYLAPGT